jgi:ComF family protein
LEFITEILDFFLPRFCPSCKIKLLSSEKFICSSCLKKIKKIDDARLKFEFNKKFYNQRIISGFTSLYLFEKDKELQHLIHALKYNGKFLTGSFLGEVLGKKIKNELQSWNINLIIPIPLHQLKKAERGYNQSFYISKGLSKEISIPVVSGIIKRRKYTQSQTTMNFLERQKNIEEAFKLKNKKEIIGKNILLIDDVITTGATISECGKVLLNAGAHKVFAASVAIAD